jgi:hypothetical protein
MRCPGPGDRANPRRLHTLDLLLRHNADPIAAAARHSFSGGEDDLFAIRQLDEPANMWSIDLDNVLGALGQTPRQAGLFTHFG